MSVFDNLTSDDLANVVKRTALLSALQQAKVNNKLGVSFQFAYLCKVLGDAEARRIINKIAARKEALTGDKKECPNCGEPFWYGHEFEVDMCVDCLKNQQQKEA
jgi:uncharacterized protein with PIN domain